MHIAFDLILHSLVCVFSPKETCASSGIFSMGVHDSGMKHPDVCTSLFLRFFNLLYLITAYDKVNVAGI